MLWLKTARSFCLVKSDVQTVSDVQFLFIAFSSCFAQTTIAENVTRSKYCQPRTSDYPICAFRKHAGPVSGLIYQELAIFSHFLAIRLCLVCLVCLVALRWLHHNLNLWFAKPLMYHSTIVLFGWIIAPQASHRMHDKESTNTQWSSSHNNTSLLGCGWKTKLFLLEIARFFVLLGFS